ncbi:MAG: hypothetical protein HYW70_00595 [Candidatus Nealsonbacteria bacterium]|nr:hypothetical protein [Candidatus Nealsonbacteria bacterium]
MNKLRENNRKGKVILALIIITISFSIFAGRTNAEYPQYRPALKAGTWMEYEFKFYPDIERMRLEVLEVRDYDLLLKVTTFYRDGKTTIEEKFFSVGVQTERVGTEVIIPLNSSDNWQSIKGKNEIKPKSDHLSLYLTPDSETGYSEVLYSFNTPQGLNKDFLVWIELENKTKGEKYSMIYEDKNGEVKVKDLFFSEPADPRIKVYAYKDTSSLTSAPGYLDYGVSSTGVAGIDSKSISKVRFVYSANKTTGIEAREFKLKAFVFYQRITADGEEYVFGTKTHRIGELIFPVIGGALKNQEQIYPDLKTSIGGEFNDLVGLKDFRTFRDHFGYLEYSGPVPVKGWYWDKQTGILIGYFDASGTPRKINLKDTNAWDGPDFMGSVFVEYRIVVGIIWANIGWPIGAAIVFPLSYLGFFIYDKATRKELSTWKQWLPWVLIMLIPTVVMILFWVYIFPNINR